MSRTISWSDNVAHMFPPGTTVEAHPRVADTLDSAPHTKAETTAKVDNNGVVTFKGLKNVDGPYWAWAWVKVQTDAGVTKVSRSIAFTANDEDNLPERSVRVSQRETVLQAEREAKARDVFAQRHPETASEAPGRTIITGPRTTVNTHPKNPDNFDPNVLEPQPAPKQEDIPDSVPQRSSTPAGMATPVDPGELQPRPSQSDVKKGTPQRSSTRFGEATPKPPDEQEPQARQEDSGKKLQRSDTPHGAQAPKPSTRSATRQEKARESSESKAVGSGTTAVAGTAKRKRASAAGKAKKATDAVKPASKRAAKRGQNQK